MLPLNRVYTPQELRAASRLTPADRQPPGVRRKQPSQPAGVSRGRALVAIALRLFGRAGLGREAPGTT